MDIQNTAEQILSLIKKNNAQGDVIIDSGESLSLKANQGQLEEYKVSSSQIVGVRVIKDDKVGTAYSEATDDAALQLMVEQALENSSYSEAEPLEKIGSSNEKLEDVSDLIFPEDNAETDKKIELLFDLESRLLAKDNIQSVPYNGVSSSVSSRALYNTSGLSTFTKQRYSAAYAYALAAKDDKNAMEGHGSYARKFNDLNIDDVINVASENCTAMLEGVPVESGSYDVIFDPENLSQLIDVFTMAFNGKSAKDGLSPWREKLGSQVADSRITLMDNPLNQDGFGYHRFDGEGLESQKTTIIQSGELSSMLHNSVTAAFFNVENTRSAVRGPKSTLAIGSSQLELAPGNDDAQLFNGEYLLITGLTGIHSGANAISGDFSFGASGYLYKNGERVQSVRGITVAGNYYQMLNNIKAVGSIQKWTWDKSALMVDVRFADLAISGE